MNKPLVLITLIYITGILAGVMIQAPAYLLLGAASLLFILGLAGYLMNWRHNGKLILLVFFCLGFYFCRLSVESIDTPLNNFAGHYVVLTGTVVQEADRREDRVSYVLKSQSARLGSRENHSAALVLANVWQPEYLYGYGDVLTVKGKLSLPEQPGNPGAFNYREYLARQGIGLVMSVNGEQNVAYSGTGESSRLVAFALSVKKKLLLVVDKTFSAEQAALVKGILFGSCGQINAEVTEAFQQTGLIHILSVSGLHVGFVLLAVLALASAFKLPLRYNLPVASFILIFYAVLTGMSPPVIRAVVMALLLLSARHLGRQRDWAVALCLAALLNLLYKPLNLFNPGFQLSFLATWGIFYLVPAIVAFLQQKLRISKRLAEVLAVPLAAEAATLPPVAMHFNLIALVAPLANIVCVPLVGAITLLSALGTTAGLLSLSLAQFINITTACLLDIFLWLVKLFQHLPGAFVHTAAPPVWAIILWYLLVIFSVNKEWRGWLGRRLPDRMLSPAGVLLFVATMLGFSSGLHPANLDGRLAVHFIDVGQGDSILLQTPAGKNILVDCGGHKGELASGTGVGDKVVLPYLRRLGVQKLDLLVLTHYHEDHMGGAAAVIRSLPVALLLVPPQDKPPGAEFSGLTEQIKGAGIDMRTAVAGDCLNLDPGLEIDVLSPPRDMNGENNDSLVLRVSFGREDFLLTGDIEKEAQDFLLQQRYNLACEVLKVPHHGSKYFLPEFLEKVKPLAAVITVGKNNFGHPSLETLKLLQELGAAVYRTDRDGAVIFRTDGNSIRVETGRK
jgi:competence protein ComEC